MTKLGGLYIEYPQPWIMRVRSKRVVYFECDPKMYSEVQAIQIVRDRFAKALQK